MGGECSCLASQPPSDAANPARQQLSGSLTQIASGASRTRAIRFQATRLWKLEHVVEPTSSAAGKRKENGLTSAAKCVRHREHALVHWCKRVRTLGKFKAPFLLSPHDARGKCVPKCNGRSDSITCYGTYLPPGWDRGIACCGKDSCSFGKCCGASRCCLDDQVCCGGGTHCCNPGSACCGDSCCDSDWICCRGGTCCPPGTVCCGDTCCQREERCAINRACVAGQCFDSGECTPRLPPPPRPLPRPPQPPPVCIRALDTDCDNVPNSRDNCPTVKNNVQVGWAGPTWTGCAVLAVVGCGEAMQADCLCCRILHMLARLPPTEPGAERHGWRRRGRRVRLQQHSQNGDCCIPLHIAPSTLRLDSLLAAGWAGAGAG